MQCFEPTNSFKVEVFGTLGLILIPLFILTVIFGFLGRIWGFLIFDCFAVLILYSVYVITPFATVKISDSSIRVERLFQWAKMINWNEIEMIKEQKIEFPFNYFGDYYLILKSTNNKVKFSSRISNYDQLKEQIFIHTNAKHWKVEKKYLRDIYIK